MSEATVLAKLSLKGMKATPAKGTLQPGDSRDIAVIYGQTTKSEVVTTTFGDSVRFSGNFKGRNIATGDEYRSARCFVPGIIEDMLSDAVADADGAPVEFAIVIGAEYSEKGNMGYAFTVRPLTPIKESSVLEHLDSVVNNALKSLPAPDKAEPEPHATNGKRAKK